MGATTLVQHNMKLSDYKPTSNPSSNKVRIVRVEEVEFCTPFVEGVPLNNIYGLMKGDIGSCKKYKKHVGHDKCDV